MPVIKRTRRAPQPIRPVITPFEHWRRGLITNNQSDDIPIDALLTVVNKQLATNGSLIDRWCRHTIHTLTGDSQFQDQIQQINSSDIHSDYRQVLSLYNNDTGFGAAGPYLIFVAGGSIYSNKRLHDGAFLWVNETGNSVFQGDDEDGNPYSQTNPPPGSIQVSYGFDAILDTYWWQYLQDGDPNAYGGEYWEGMIQLSNSVFLLFDGGPDAPLGVFDPTELNGTIVLDDITGHPTVDVVVPLDLQPGETDFAYPYFLASTYAGEGARQFPYRLGETGHSELHAFQTNAPLSEWTESLAPIITVGAPVDANPTQEGFFFVPRLYLAEEDPSQLFLIDSPLGSDGELRSDWTDSDGNRLGPWWTNINPLISAPTTNTTGRPKGVKTAAILGNRLLLGGMGRIWYDIPARRLNFSQTSDSGSFRFGSEDDEVVKIVEIPRAGEHISSLIFTRRNRLTRVYLAQEITIDWHGPYTNFDVELLSGVEGTSWPESIVLDSGDIYWLAESGFKRYGSDGYEDISLDINGCVRKAVGLLNTRANAWVPGIRFDDKMLWQLPADVDGANEIWAYDIRRNRGAWMKPWEINSKSLFIASNPDEGEVERVHCEIQTTPSDDGLFQGTNRIHTLLPERVVGLTDNFDTLAETGDMVFNQSPQLTSSVYQVRLDFGFIKGKITIEVFGRTSRGRNQLLRTKVRIVKDTDGERITKNQDVRVRVGKRCRSLRVRIRSEQYVSEGVTTPSGYSLRRIEVIHYPTGLDRSGRVEREAFE